MASGSERGVRLETEGLCGQTRSSPSVPYNRSRDPHPLSDNNCATRWSNFTEPPSRLPPQQQTVRLYLDNSDGKQEFQPDKPESFCAFLESACAQLLSSNTVYCVRPSQPPELHVPDGREQLLQRIEL